MTKTPMALTCAKPQRRMVDEHYFDCGRKSHLGYYIVSSRRKMFGLVFPPHTRLTHELTISHTVKKMSSLSEDSITSPSDDQAVMDDKANSAGLKPRRSLKALRKLQSLTNLQPRMSRSTSDLGNMSMPALASSSRVSDPEELSDPEEPQEALDKWTMIKRSGERRKRMKARQVLFLLDSLTSEEKSRWLLDERDLDQETTLRSNPDSRPLKKEKKDERKLHPRVRCVYGDLKTPRVTPDIRDEVYADDRLSDRKSASFRAFKERWSSDKARGVHYPSFLQASRKALTSAMARAQKVEGENDLGTDHQKAQDVRVAQKRCKGCAEPLKAVPSEMDRSEWLALLYLRRARHCKRLKPDASRADRARSIVLDRALKGNESHLVTWTNGSDNAFVPRPSPLSRGQWPDPNEDGASDSTSVYSQESNPAILSVVMRPGVYTPVEVPGLLWMKSYRVPQFIPGTGQSRWSPVPAGEAFREIVRKRHVEPPAASCDINKPLPPLPAPD